MAGQIHFQQNNNFTVYFFFYKDRDRVFTIESIMLSLLQISTIHKLWPAGIALYISAFPPDERREPSELTEVLNENMHRFYTIIEEGQFVGIMEIWDFTDFIFLEHLAIKPELQNKGYGSTSLEYLKNMVNKPILLEAEIPVDDVSKQRVDFYEKAGFKAINIDYTQPPYYPKKVSVPMLLLSDYPVSLSDAYSYISIISKKVYKIA